MAKINAKQRDLLILELQLSATACRLNMDNPDGDKQDMSHKNIMDIIRITRLLLHEISIHEFLVGIKDKGLREYYQELIDNNVSPGQYKKKGYGPNHGKVGPKKK